MLLSVMGGQHREKNIYGGPGASTAQVSIRPSSATQTTGGFTAYDNQNFKRNVIKGDLTKYWDPHDQDRRGLRGHQRLVDRFRAAPVSASTSCDRRQPGSSTTGTGTTWTIRRPASAVPIRRPGRS